MERYRLHEELRALLAATGYPYATLSMGKGLLEETHPQFIGIYNGAIIDTPPTPLALKSGDSWLNQSACLASSHLQDRGCSVPKR